MRRYDPRHLAHLNEVLAAEKEQAVKMSTSCTTCTNYLSLLQFKADKLRLSELISEHTKLADIERYDVARADTMQGCSYNMHLLFPISPGELALCATNMASEIKKHATGYLVHDTKDMIIPPLLKSKDGHNFWHPFTSRTFRSCLRSLSLM
ncbi:hypothetical protein OF83DRAFT_1088595 [Amylostereum chailletii]|nr:hypothetical protein OF83DRAFT_1088595 [Amylostereum chailletii]